MVKKIFSIVLLFLVCISSVNAKTYYTNYSEYSDYSLELMEESDTVFVDKLNTNRYYKNNYIYSDEYYLIGDNPSDYPYQSSDYITNKVTDLSTKPNDRAGRTITEVAKRKASDVLPIKYIKLSNVSNYGSIVVNSISLKSKISTTITVSENEVLVDLNDYYFVEDIYSTIIATSYTYQLLRDVDGPVYYEKIVSNGTSKVYFSSLSYKSPEYGEEYLIDGYDGNYNSSMVCTYYVYDYEDKLYKYYYIEKEYGPLYEYSEEYPIKGEEVTIYRYKTRDKIEVLDNIVITDENDIHLDDIVVDSSIPYEIISNLDLAVNGKYTATILIDSKEIKVDIIVDKKSNVVDALVKEVELNNELKKEVNSLNNIVNTQYMDMKDTISITNEQIDELNNELLIEKEKNKQLKNDKQDIEDVIVEKKVNKQVFLPVCFIIIFLISVYFYLKRSDTNNS